jgi:hypothetical protein
MNPLRIILGLMGAICLLSVQADTGKILPIIDMHMHAFPPSYSRGSPWS